MKRKTLLIISHTEHYLDTNQQIVGWGSTISEVNYLADFWEQVIHIGCLHPTSPPANALPYTKKNIRFVALPPYGGTTFASKLGILFKIPKITSTVIKNLHQASEVQLRLPTSMGLFLLPLFSFFVPRKYTFWVKYAGDWNQIRPPLSYGMQRGWLKSNFAKCPVTINGFWPNQPQHCLSFENPCLTLDQWNQGLKITQSKNFSGNFNLVFIGRLDASKGMNLILEALEKISLTKVHQIHFIGDSNERSFFEEKASFLKEKAVFHGFLATEQVHQILEDAHFILLPSQSEGFPKVIAEAACYGAISIVSNVGSISHYINETNGFVWQVDGNRGYESVLKMALESNVEKLSQQSKNAVLIAKLFTFENYRIKLEKYILSNNENQI